MLQVEEVAVVIIGGGITGLSAAWDLVRAGREVTLVEPGPLGGLLHTEQIDSCVVECGADSWIRSKPWLRALAEELGLGEDVVPSNDALRKTFFVRAGRLVPLPRGLRLIAPTEWKPILRSSLFSWQTKARMLLETRRKPQTLPDRTVSEFVRDHFGSEAVEYLAEPLFAGVYGGAPETLGAAGVLPKMFEYESQYGSVIRGARAEPVLKGSLFESMRGGLGQIPAVLAAKLKGQVRFVQSTAETAEDRRVRVGGEWMDAEGVILACGAASAARILTGRPAELLSSISHSSATIFVFGFHRAELQSTPVGFGFLVPRKERRVIMGATWVTNKFPERAPSDVVIVRCFVSGDHPDSRADEVLKDLARLTDVGAKPWFTRVYRWPESMPQYGVGHAALIAEIQALLPQGIGIAGNYLSGVGMPDCVRSGRTAARQLTGTLSSSSSTRQPIPVYRGPGGAQLRLR